MRNDHVLFLSEFLRALHFIGPVLVPFFMSHGLSMLQIMVLQSIYQGSVLLLEIPTGAIADRFGRKASTIAGGLIQAIGAIVYGTSGTFQMFAVAEILWAFGVTFQSGSRESYAYWAFKGIKKGMGRFFSMSRLGYLVSGLVGGFIASLAGFSMNFYLMAASFALSSIVLGFLPESPEKSRKKYHLHVISSMKSVLSNKLLLLLVLDSTFGAMFMYYFLWLYQPLLIKASVPISLFGVFLGISTISEISFLNSIKWLEGLFGSENRLAVAMLVIPALSFVVAGAFLGVLSALLLMVAGGGLGLIRREFMKIIISRYSPANQRATILSLRSMLSSVGKVVANPFIGLLVDRSFSLAFFVPAAALLAVTALTISWGRLAEKV